MGCSRLRRRIDDGRGRRLGSSGLLRGSVDREVASREDQRNDDDRDYSGVWARVHWGALAESHCSSLRSLAGLG